jgi:GT2 family glycosyltransferase
MLAPVSVTIVTFNSSRYIARCLDAVLCQDWPVEVVVVDNASSDATRSLLRPYSDRIALILNDKNEGFAAAQNRAIAASTGKWVLTLNPDVLMGAGFIRRLVEAGEADPATGTVCGKLLSIGPGFEPLERSLIDSTGIYFTPEMRHFDRGWHEPDDGRYDRLEYVFGASAAAALYRREMIEDLDADGDFFDPDFFAYREDADVAFRAQWLGWGCIYTPDAVAHHVRTVVPGSRRGIPAVLNMHSVKNRFLMRIKNCSTPLFRRYWLAITMRDLLVVGGCLFWEPRSLPAFWRLARCCSRAVRRRRDLFARRRVGEDSIGAWIAGVQAARPASLAVPLSSPRPGLRPSTTPAGLTPVA